jgi:hypothetical protein
VRHRVVPNFKHFRQVGEMQMALLNEHGVVERTGGAADRFSLADDGGIP